MMGNIIAPQRRSHDAQFSVEASWQAANFTSETNFASEISARPRPATLGVGGNLFKSQQINQAVGLRKWLARVMRKWVLGAVMQLHERADQKVWEEPGQVLKTVLANINNLNGRLQTQVDLSHFYWQV